MAYLSPLDQIKKIASKLEKKASNFITHTAPRAAQNVVNNAAYGFWHSPVGKAAVNTQKFMESPAKLKAPTVKPFRETTPLGKGANLVTNFGSQMATDLLNVPYTIGSDTGRMIGNKLTGQPLPSYQSLKSPLFRLAYNAKGQSASPQQVIGNIAGVGADALTAYTPKALTTAGKNIVTNAGKSTFLKSIAGGARTGGITAGLYGGLSGLSEGRNDTIPEQLIKGGTGLAAGGAAGALLGGGIGAVGYPAGKLRDAIIAQMKKMKPELAEKEAIKLSDQFIRDQLGRFVSGGKKKEPEFYKRMRHELGLPENGLNERGGFVDLSAMEKFKSPWQKLREQIDKELPDVPDPERLNQQAIDASTEAINRSGRPWDILRQRAETITDNLTQNYTPLKKTNYTPLAIAQKHGDKTVFTEYGKQKMGNLMYQDRAEKILTGKAPAQSRALETTPRPPVAYAPQDASHTTGKTRIPIVRETLEGKVEISRPRSREGQAYGQSLSDTIVKNNDIDVKNKVGLLDYIRTPDRILKKIGLEKEGLEVRKRYEQYQMELPKEIDKISQWAKQVDQKSNIQIFRYLDGRDVTLQPKEQKIANEVKEYLSLWAKKLGLPEDKQISSYITHIFEKDFIQKEFDPDIAKIIRDKVPGSVYDPFLQKRLGQQGYIEDTWRALDAYVKRATRKFHMDPVLAKLQEKSEGLEQSQFDYVKNYVERVNMRPTKIDNLIDNTIKQVVGYKYGQRPTAFLTQKARQAIYRGTLGLNVGSALKNLSQVNNTYAKLGEKYTVVGYTKLLKNMIAGSDELERVGVLKGNLIQDRVMSAKYKAIERMDKGLFFFFETAERINRGAAYFGAKSKALSQGMNEEKAIEYAKNIVRDTQFTFGSVDTPVALQSDIAKTLAQFQTYSTKQAEFLGEMMKAKDIAGLMRYTIGSIAVMNTIGQLYGMELKDIVPSFRIGLPPTMQAPFEIGKAVTGAPDKYGNVPDIEQRVKNVGKSLVPLVPGGVQIKKTLEGLKATSQGYSESQTGRAQYPVPQDAASRVKGAVFGKSSFSERQEYFDNDRSALGTAQTEALKNAPDKQLYYESIIKDREYQKQQKEARKQAESLISDMQKLSDPEEKRALLAQWDSEGKLTPEFLKELDDVLKAEKVKSAGNFAVAVHGLGSNRSRANYIVEYMKDKSPEDKTKILTELNEAGLLTADLLEELAGALSLIDPAGAAY